MSNLVDKYMKKVAKETEDPELRDSINDMFDRLDSDAPFVTRPKSSFKEANKRMKEIEDGRRDKT